jgi:membrane dipeptidase
VAYVEGLESPAEYPNLVRWLVAHGYTDAQIATAMGGSILRALGEVWV